MEIITEYIQEEKEEHLVIGGDYNARTGNRGGPIREDKEKEKEGESRNSRDKMINRERRVLINKIEEREWMILNGSYNNEGGWTYYIGGSGVSVIDYVMAKRRKRLERQQKEIESNHVSLEVELEAELKGTKTRKEVKKRILKKQKEVTGRKKEQQSTGKNVKNGTVQKRKTKTSGAKGESKKFNSKSKEENNTLEIWKKRVAQQRMEERKKVFKKNVQRIKKGENRLEGICKNKEKL